MSDQGCANYGELPFHVVREQGIERKAGAPLFAPRPSSCSGLRLLQHYSMKWKVSMTFFPRSSKRCSPRTPAYLPVPPLMALTPGASPERLG